MSLHDEMDAPGAEVAYAARLLRSVRARAHNARAYVHVRASLRWTRAESRQGQRRARIAWAIGVLLVAGAASAMLSRWTRAPRGTDRIGTSRPTNPTIESIPPTAASPPATTRQSPSPTTPATERPGVEPTTQRSSRVTRRSDRAQPDTISERSTPDAPLTERAIAITQSVPMAPAAPPELKTPAPREADPAVAIDAMDASLEAQLLVDALIAVRRDHDAARASTLIDFYLQHYPIGPLVEEALALRVETAVAKGAAPVSVAALAAEYQRRFPSGRYGDEIRKLASAARR